MKAMILKDLLCLKHQAKSVLLVLLVWLVISVATSNAQFFSALGILYIVMLPMTTLSYDERASWDRRALTMPVTRAQVVLSRYVTALLAGLFICAVVAAVIGVMDGPEHMPLSLGFYLLGVFMLSLGMPLMLWLGVEKARILVALCYLVPFCLLLLSEKLGLDVVGFLSGLSRPTLVLTAVIAVLGVPAASALLSVAIYKKKEF